MQNMIIPLREGIGLVTMKAIIVFIACGLLKDHRRKAV
jgi:hypothetical protein